MRTTLRASDQSGSGAVSTRDAPTAPPNPATFIARPLVVRSFTTQITTLDGAVITILRVRQHASDLTAVARHTASFATRARRCHVGRRWGGRLSAH